MTDFRKDVFFQPVDDVFGGIFFPARQTVFVPVPGNFFKGIFCPAFFLLYFFSLVSLGINTASDQFLRFFPFEAGFLEGYGWIFAESQFNGFVIYPAFHFPQFGAGRRDLQIQATAVEKGIGLVFGLGVVDLFGDKRSDQFGHFGYF